jgi:hypothetical protein
MADSFGPWGSGPTRNQWDDVKIGQMEAWYQMISLAFNGASDSRSVPDPEPRSDVRVSSKQLPAPGTKQPTSKIPVSTKTIRASKPEEPVIQQPDSHPERPEVDLGFVNYQPRDNWEEPHPFAAFMANPQFGLQPWPQVPVPLDESIKRFLTKPVPERAEPKPGRTSNRAKK